MLEALRYIFFTELILLWRRSHEWLYPLGFFIIILSLFPLAFSPDPAFLEKYIAGGLWIAALFANLLAIENIFYADSEEGNLEQMLLSSIPLPLLLLAKLCTHWLVTILPLIILTPFICILFQLSWPSIAIICISLLLGTPILTLLGSLGVALTLGLRQQGMLLGLLILPLIIPVLIFGVNIVQQFQAGFSIAGPLSFLAGIKLLVITFLPWAISATLRISLED